MDHPDLIPGGLAIDPDHEAITLQTSLTNMAFVLEPETNAAASKNGIAAIMKFHGCLYLSYGDLGNNLGPVDIVSYHPESGSLQREMLKIPEEEIGGWSLASDQTLYVGGADAKEDWSFGNFYYHDGIGWQKRRTIPRGLHVFRIIPYQHRLYAFYSSDRTSLVNYRFLLASENNGASWSYDRIDTNTVEYFSSDFSSDNGIVVPHKTGEYLYFTGLTMTNRPHGHSQGLYRFDGKNTKIISFPGIAGNYDTRSAFCFKDKLILIVQTTCRITNCFTHAIYAIDENGPSEVNCPGIPVACWEGNNGYFICIRPASMSYDDHCNIIYLYQTKDFTDWEKLGIINLPAGVSMQSACMMNGRLYVGACAAFHRPGTPCVTSTRLNLWSESIIGHGRISWDADVPAGAQVKVQFGLQPGGDDKTPAQFICPEGTTQTYFTVSGQAFSLMTNTNTQAYFVADLYKIPNAQGQRPLIRWFRLETATNTYTLAVDQGQGLYAAVNVTNRAEYISPVIELDEPIGNGRFFCESAAPSQTQVQVLFRSAPDRRAITEQPFVGPADRPDSFYNIIGGPLNPKHNGNRYIQYKAVLTSANPVCAPYLRSVVIDPRGTLDHFEIIADSYSWRAGESNRVTIMAHSSQHKPVPLTARLSLTTMNNTIVGSATAHLCEGTGIVALALQKALPTTLHAALGRVQGSSPEIAVFPGVLASIGVDMKSRSKGILHWSPVVAPEERFDLVLMMYDRYRNIVTNFTGPVECWRYDHIPRERVFEYNFQPEDRGRHTLTACLTNVGEWNLVMSTPARPSVAGSQTIRVKIKQRGQIVSSWYVIGCFPGDKSQIGFKKEYEVEKDVLQFGTIDLKKIYQGVEGGYEKAVWQKEMSQLSGDLDDVVLFDDLFGQPEFMEAYAYSMIYSPEDRKCVMEVRSDDGIRIWIEGKLVLDHNIARGISWEPDKLEINLKKGWNRILVKLENVWGSWGFRFRFLKPDGTAYKDITVACDGK